jgi:hypothetical protein
MPARCWAKPQGVQHLICQPTQLTHFQSKLLLLCCRLQLKGYVGGAAFNTVDHHDGGKGIRTVEHLQAAQPRFLAKFSSLP